MTILKDFKDALIKTLWKYSGVFASFMNVSGNRGFVDNNDDVLVCNEICDMMDTLKSEVKTVADVGCGRGVIAHRLSTLSNSHVVGIDYLNHFRWAPEKTLAYTVADSRYLPFKGGVFDFIYCYSVLQYMKLDDVYLLLREFVNILNDDGVIFLGELIEKKGYFNDHLFKLKMNPIKKLILFLYLNTVYQYYVHPKQKLEKYYRDLGLEATYIPQDQNLPYSDHVYHAVLKKRTPENRNRHP